jgi:hypothetical protein
MYPLSRRRIPGVVSLGLVLILLGVLLAVVSLARLQTASAQGHQSDAAALALHQTRLAPPGEVIPATDSPGGLPATSRLP